MRAALAVAVVALAAPACGQATTYYVSPSGSDRAAGTSPDHAWRTVDRVDRARLGSGDTVLFAGGARFDGLLMPPTSRTSYGSYGGGRAHLGSARGAVWLPPGTSHVSFTNLELTGGRNAAFAGSARGSGNHDVAIERCVIHDTGGAGIVDTNAADDGWRIVGNTIRNVGDSGIIFLGSRFRIERNTIVDTGESRAITWAKHGIYAKGPDATITNNTIARYQADGISLRFRNATVVGNRIGAGGIAIAWFQNDARAGTTRIEDNILTGSTASGIYVSPADSAGATRESFVIRGNTIRTAGGNAFDIERTAGSVSIVGNRITGRHDLTMSLERPGGDLIESSNTWRRDGGLPILRLGSSAFSSLERWRAGTGLGAGDTLG